MNNIEDLRNEGFNAGTVAALGVIRAQDCGVTWREVVEAAGAHEVMVYALLQDGDWEWAGFAQYAESELGKSAVTKAKAEARRIRKARTVKSNSQTEPCRAAAEIGKAMP